MMRRDLDESLQALLEAGTPGADILGNHWQLYVWISRKDQDRQISERTSVRDFARRGLKAFEFAAVYGRVQRVAVVVSLIPAGIRLHARRRGRPAAAGQTSHAQCHERLDPNQLGKNRSVPSALLRYLDETLP